VWAWETWGLCMTQCESLRQWDHACHRAMLIRLTDNHFLGGVSTYRVAILDGDWNTVNGTSVISENCSIHGRSGVLIDVMEVNAEEEEKTLCCLKDDRRAMPPCNARRKKPVSCAYSERSVRPNGLYLSASCPVSPLSFSFSYSLFLLIVRTSYGDVTHVERRAPCLACRGAIPFFLFLSFSVSLFSSFYKFFHTGSCISISV
jgi:hypothetical protein